VTAARRVFLLLGALGALLLVPAAPASAHAVLVSSDPPANSSLSSSPESITLRFNEPVEVALGSVRVLDAKGERVDRGSFEHPGGDPSRVRVQLREGLEGGFAVGWRVISADSHPATGAFTFGVGEGSAEQAKAVADELLAGGGGSKVVGTLFMLARLGIFAGLTILIGAAVFVIVIWRAGFGHPAVRRLLWGAWGAAVVGTVASIGLQGAYASGLGIGSAVDPSLLAEIITTRYGLVSMGRLSLLGLTILVLLALGRPALAEQRDDNRRRLAEDGAALGAAGLLLTLGLAGHAGTGPFIPIGILADLLHLAGISVWLGGLVLLVTVVLPRREADELRAVVPRFSSIAFWAVVTIVASGTVQAWRQLGSLGALTGTTYGRLLLVKVGLVAVIVATAWASRRLVGSRLGRAALVPRPAGPGADAFNPDVETTTRLRRLVGIEVGLAAVVLAVTSLLVQAAPARSGSAGVTFDNVAPGAPVRGAFGATLRAGDTTVIITTDPARTGANSIHFTLLDPNGQLKAVPEFRVSLALKEQGLGPIKLELTDLGPGHYWAANVLIPIAGEWALTVTVRTSDLDESTATSPMRIR
jgi:copper transport protein